MAHRQAFYDPFASIHLRLEESTPSYSISEWFPAPLPNHETPDGEAAIMMMSDQSPIALKPLPLPLIIANPSPDTDGDLESQRGRASIQLPIKGQGVIAVRVPPGDCEGLTISVWSSSSGVFPPTMLSLNLRKKSCSLEYSTPDNTTPIEWKKPKSEQASYLQEGTVEETYWLSVDRPNGWIRWGRGYTNVALATGEVELKYKDDTGVMVWKDKGKFEWLDTVQDVRYTLWGPNYDNSNAKIVVLPLPLVADLPPYIINNSDVTLSDLENNNFTVPQNLTPECQRLYHNVAGANILLDDKSFPYFSQAIQESVNTEGKLGFNMLAKKAAEFGKPDIEGTYLRITLGRDMGDSPGVPYVLEIWPAGHYSPIHDHGDSNAVIKVLHGLIHAKYFDSLTVQPRPNQIGTAILKQGDITWLSPNNYQVHQLCNPDGKGPTGLVAITIQCYRYTDQDKVHHESFRYLEKDGGPEVKEFVPNS
ncbi:hypothetical protein NLI96_g6558 [Meripilus lineatus]|uniref:Cysteine dioxygenase n=1 Tax=Meripilus lineatus TaxID=2056292 RepID=A0AAD5V0N3_9APHY|nr:hypothetical protein NLI96_g6558 [Physisporinus lineatus]